MTFAEAIALCEQGLADWKAKPHNQRWWKKIDGTPIPNDLLVCIALKFATVPEGEKSPEANVTPSFL